METNNDWRFEMSLWSSKSEIDFFLQELERGVEPEKLFYKLQNEYFAYVPKDMSAQGRVLNARNALIGKYTEDWCKSVFDDVAQSLGYHAVKGVVCEELELKSNSPADLAFCTSPDQNQKPSGIKLLFEIKMSIISNYKYTPGGTVEWFSHYNGHRGNPSILRSDSMLKAFGKAINIRVSSKEQDSIPIIVLGNSPITVNYVEKVDSLVSAGVLQGIWSLNPKPADSDYIKESDKKGFITIEEKGQLHLLCEELVTADKRYFSSMMDKEELGKIIFEANKEEKYISKAESFLSLIKGEK